MVLLQVLDDLGQLFGVILGESLFEPFFDADRLIATIGAGPEVDLENCVDVRLHDAQRPRRAGRARRGRRAAGAIVFCAPSARSLKIFTDRSNALLGVIWLES